MIFKIFFLTLISLARQLGGITRLQCSFTLVERIQRDIQDILVEDIGSDIMIFLFRMLKLRVSIKSLLSSIGHVEILPLEI